MGLIIVIVWLGALGLLGLPALGLGIVVSARNQRTRAFWLACGAAVLVSVLGQYIFVLTPVVSRGTYDLDLVFTAAVGWHLLPPAIAAVALWIAARVLRRPSVAGAAAGLFLSIPMGIGLAVPEAMTIPSLLGLKFEP